MSEQWLENLASSTKQLRSSAIRDLLALIDQPGMISFAGGLPAPECFPTEELTAAAERVLVNQPLAALQYGRTEGYVPLTKTLIDLMQQRGLTVTGDDMMVLNGSQQGLDMIAKLFVDSESIILVEDPTYLGALQAFRPYNPKFVTIPMDEGGIKLDALEEVLQQGINPRFLYTVPCFQNPTGITATPERKRGLVELAAKYKLPIVEDDPYGELYYEGDSRPPILAAIDAEIHGELSNVIYLSTFSKLLAPGLRLGWIIAPQSVMRHLVHFKQGMDLQSGSLSQAVAYEACRDGLLERHVPFIRKTYHERRDAMLAALEREMPEGVTWTRPAGGMFLWITLPESIDAAELLKESVEQKVAFVPGGAFYANGGGSNTMRLNFSYSSAELINEGVSRLARSIRQKLSQ
jgi:2-aminoadipate transaminase